MNGHDSVRPSFSDDLLVQVRLRPSSLAALREGQNVKFHRLDTVPGQDGVYDIYCETAQEIDAVPAWDAPHSPDFRPADA